MSNLETLEQRIRQLEVWKNEQATSVAVREERDRHMDKRFDRLEESVGEVKGYLLRIVWIIVLGILGSLITFIIGGGLSIVP